MPTPFLLENLRKQNFLGTSFGYGVSLDLKRLMDQRVFSSRSTRKYIKRPHLNTKNRVLANILGLIKHPHFQFSGYLSTPLFVL
ncbi:hypothetical protein BpHYR1_021717 [Brachionus plicatilis]|uniref:Uncharacterized protein n=1 Tax=Brachionus plicatilis TaxID=10195 RepID=A0A3M7T603_BRAPC|nr:hypothetical protein BpHYR1_021717 [Brachionus plicatilis]